jgi:hypothetical protein
MTCVWWCGMRCNPVGAGASLQARVADKIIVPAALSMPAPEQTGLFCLNAVNRMPRRAAKHRGVAQTEVISNTTLLLEASLALVGRLSGIPATPCRQSDKLAAEAVTDQVRLRAIAGADSFAAFDIVANARWTSRRMPSSIGLPSARTKSGTKPAVVSDAAPACKNQNGGGVWRSTGCSRRRRSIPTRSAS